MANTVVQGVLFTAILLLLASFRYIKDTFEELHPGRVRTAWLWLTMLLVLAVLGGSVFLGINSTEGPSHHGDWVVALTLLASALFVFTVCVLSRSTAKDIARIGDLERVAYFDPLTKLYTRGKIISMLETECSKCKQDNAPVSVIMLDVDDLKFINDCFGHHAGDSVLEEVGRVLTENAGRANFLGRYGGDELIVVLPNTMPFYATEVAERVRKAVAAKNFVFDGETVSITTSIGVATSTTFRETCDELIATADRTLYMAKLKGRNKTLHAEDAFVRKPAVRAENEIHMLPENELGKD